MQRKKVLATRSSKIKMTTRIIRYVKKTVTSSQFDLSQRDLSRDLSLNLQEENLEKAFPELQDKESYVNAVDDNNIKGIDNLLKASVEKRIGSYIYIVLQYCYFRDQEYQHLFQ